MKHVYIYTLFIPFLGFNNYSFTFHFSTLILCLFCTLCSLNVIFRTQSCSFAEIMPVRTFTAIEMSLMGSLQIRSSKCMKTDKCNMY